MKKIAIIFGITDQDGAYLLRLLIKKYIVHGVIRRSSSFNTSRIDQLYVDPHYKSNFKLHYGDLSDSLSVLNIIKKISPHEIYNLGAQSHVQVSFQVPEYTANVDALGALRILDSIKTLNLQNKIKYYQAGTSEMFGRSKPPQNEKTMFYPRSPMLLLNFTHIGLQSIIERLMGYLLVMVFYLTTKSFKRRDFCHQKDCKIFM